MKQHSVFVLYRAIFTFELFLLKIFFSNFFKYFFPINFFYNNFFFEKFKKINFGTNFWKRKKMDKLMKSVKIAFWWYYPIGTKQNCSVVIQMIRFDVQKNFEPKTNCSKITRKFNFSSTNYAMYTDVIIFHKWISGEHVNFLQIE